MICLVSETWATVVNYVTELSQSRLVSELDSHPLEGGAYSMLDHDVWPSIPTVIISVEYIKNLNPLGLHAFAAL